MTLPRLLPEERRAAFAVMLIVVAIVLLGMCASRGALGQHAGHGQHFHPPQHAALHENFYSDWMRPDDRSRSCCNLKDCEPVEARKIPDGPWEIKRPADGKWLTVPWTQVERERESPDPRAHACFQAPEVGDAVHCFVVGSGG